MKPPAFLSSDGRSALARLLPADALQDQLARGAHVRDGWAGTGPTPPRPQPLPNDCSRNGVHLMNKLLAIASVVAMMSACSGLSPNAGGKPSGASVAAMLGYHGPVERSWALDSN